MSSVIKESEVRLGIAKMLVELAYCREPRVDFLHLECFLRNFVITQDEHDADSPFKALPLADKPYLLRAAQEWYENPLIVIAKSRQVMVTWLFCACFLWDALFRKGRLNILVSKKEEDADKLLTRIKGIYSRLTPQEYWHGVFPAKKSPGSEWGSYCRLEFRHNSSRIIGLSQDPNAIRQETASNILCIAPETRILTKDLRWIQAKYLLIGDELVGFDEQIGVSGSKTNGVGVARQYKNAIVQQIVEKELDCYKLTFDDGTEVICSKEHRWLTGFKQTLKWMETEKMRVQTGDRAGTKVIKPVHVFNEIDSYDAGYLAAAFDGEGCLTQGKIKKDRGCGYAVRLTVSQNENEMFSEIIRIFKKYGFHYSISVLRSKKYSSPHHVIVIQKRPEIIEIMGKIRPKRLLNKIDFDRWGTMLTRGGVNLVEKTFIGKHKVIGLKTSTGTFIAEGLASHNSDEMAFQERARETFIAMKPTLDGGGRFVGVSTPNGKEFFYSLFNNEDNGFKKLRIHWSEDKKKDSVWLEKARKGMDEDAWQQEQEINFTRAGGRAMYPRFDYQIHVKDLVARKHAKLLCGIDFGFRHPAMVVAQVSQRDQLCVLDEYMPENIEVYEFGKRCLYLIKQKYPWHFANRKDYIEWFCDPAGNQRNDKSEMTSIQILREKLKIFCRFKRVPIKQGITIIQNLLLRRSDASPGILIDRQCKILIEGFMGGYEEEKPKDGRASREIPVSDDYYSHLQDSLRYIAIHTFNVYRKPLISEVDYGDRYNPFEEDFDKEPDKQRKVTGYY